MKCSDYIVDYLISMGVTDTFGVPGGVILKLLYSMEQRKPELTPHLNYHEQMAGFAACGYAQSCGKLGVAYATRGPGITNMITCMAEAYYDSISVLFITAHSNISRETMRSEYDQEVYLVDNVRKFTKYSAQVETIEEVPKMLYEACDKAISGRPGAVFLDFSAKLFDQEIEIPCDLIISKEVSNTELVSIHNAINSIKSELQRAKRPVVLIGDGIRQSGTINQINQKLTELNVPVLSSRYSQDIFCKSPLYYGYIGSHGMRYSNFILSKADLIITLGNRLSFPVNSKSFSPIVENTNIIRLDVDEDELQRNIPNAQNYIVDLVPFMNEFLKVHFSYVDTVGWINICNTIKEKMLYCDISYPVKHIAEYILLNNDKCGCYVCDVGNNEFWTSRAFEMVHPQSKLLYSKSYGTLGSSIGRAIGAYYAIKMPVVCLVGDQGFQCNIQELQFIKHENLPIKIVILNNFASGMIKDQETRLFNSHYVHTTIESGYSVPDFRRIVEAYGIKYISYSENDIHYEELKSFVHELYSDPLVYEIIIDDEISLSPMLPIGNICQDMYPFIDRDIYVFLDEL